MSASPLTDLPLAPAAPPLRAAPEEGGPRGARLGVVLFLASESLLFAGLFALYAAYHQKYPQGFLEGVRHDLRWDGSANTAILLISSACAAAALPLLARDRGRGAARLLLVTVCLGACFLGLKGYEYADHLHEGIGWGGRGAFYRTHHTPGLPQFFDLYWLMTGLHALHVLAGMTWMGIASWLARRGRRAFDHVELATMYWHFVDLVWVFLWPLFYLLGGGF